MKKYLNQIFLPQIPSDLKTNPKMKFIPPFTVTVLSILFVLSTDAVIFDCVLHKSLHETLSDRPLILNTCSTRVPQAIPDDTLLEVQIKKTDNTDANINVNDIEALYVYKNDNLVHIPSGINNFMPKIKVIKWRDSVLEFIFPDDLRQFPHLEGLYLHRNKIKRIHKIFQFTPRLQEIAFDNNEISYVSEGLLDGLSELKWADFRWNKCVDMMAVGKTEISILGQKLTALCQQNSFEFIP